MLKVHRNTIVALCLAALVGAFAGSAAAENLYVYDFDANVGQPLTVGAKLCVQDNWELHASSGDDEVTVESGASGWSGKYAYHTESISQLNRPNDEHWSFSLQDGKDFDISAVFSCDLHYRNFMGLDYNRTTGNQNWLVFGPYDYDFRWFLRESGPGGTTTSLFDYSEIKPVGSSIYKVGLEVTAKGGNQYDFQPYYQDVAGAGPKVEANGGTPLTVTLSSNLSGMFDMLYLRMGGGKLLGIVDDFRISQVPEPSALALLTCGLIGLLAYGWRRRK